MVIYGLVDPRTGQIRYVGETVRPLHKRVSQHLTTARKQTTPHVNAWLRSIIDAGLRPVVVELEGCSAVAEMHEAETFWIGYMRAIGADLVNVAPGGSTRVGYRHSEETKARWRLNRSGVNHPRYGKPVSDEQRAVMAENARKQIAKNGHPLLGKQRSPETRAKISAGRKGVRLNPDSEAKRLEALRLFHADPIRRAQWLARKSAKAQGDNNPMSIPNRQRRAMCEDRA